MLHSSRDTRRAMDSQRWTVGVDFGGTTIKAGLVGASGRVTRLCALSSGGIGRPGPFVETLGKAIEALAQSVGVRPAQLRGVGVGAPGPVDVARGVVHLLVNVPGWHNVPLGARLERRLGCPCAVDNDVNLFTLGEWRFGAGHGARSLVGLTLGTGVGGGLMCDGALYRGASGAAGEVGHMVIDPRARRCGCGARGCLEAHVGTSAILHLARAALQRGAPTLRAVWKRCGGRLTPAMVAQAANRGDAAARRVWRDVGHALGIGVANLVNALNPDCIVIGGGVAKAWPHFAPTMLATVRAQAMRVSVEAVRIVRAQLGDSSGILGAAVLVWDETASKGHGTRDTGRGRDVQ